MLFRSGLTSFVTDHYINQYKIRKEKKKERIEANISEYLKNQERMSIIGEESFSDQEKLQLPKVPEIEPLQRSKVLIETFLMSFKLLYSSTKIICFFLMVIAHIFNGNMLSFVYVLCLFCYAILIRCRPHRLYWKIMLFYAGTVVFVKYIFVLIEYLLVYVPSISEETYEDLHKTLLYDVHLALL